MTKKEMAQALAQQCDLSQQKALEILSAIFDTAEGKGIIATELETQGEKVTIPGFGTFATRVRKARTGKNPGSNEEIQIPARRYAYFTPGKTLKERVQEVQD